MKWEGMADVLVVGPGYDIHNKRLGEVLRAGRLRAGLSVDDVAKTLSVTAAYVRLIERGERVPAEETARQLLTILGVDFKVEPDVRDGDGQVDLVFSDPNRPDYLYAIEFKSRVKSRRTDERSAVDERLAEWVDSQVSDIEARTLLTAPDRDALLGRIVQLLATADSEVLQAIEMTLQRPRTLPTGRD